MALHQSSSICLTFLALGATAAGHVGTEAEAGGEAGDALLRVGGVEGWGEKEEEMIHLQCYKQ